MNLRLIKSKLKNNLTTIAGLQKVTKVFSNGETVIKDLDLNVQKSDFLTLLGKS